MFTSFLGYFRIRTLSIVRLQRDILNGYLYFNPKADKFIGLKRRRYPKNLMFQKLYLVNPLKGGQSWKKRKVVECLEELDNPEWDMYDVQEYEGLIAAMEDFANTNDDYEGF